MSTSQNQLMSRRRLLREASMGFGALAFSGLMDREATAAAAARSGSPLAARPSHFPAKARSVIFLYMDGGVSQVDSFDPKPRLAKEHGQKPKFKVDATVFNNNGNILASPWEFKQHGQSGIPISSLFPHIAKHADELCVIRSMTAFSPNHPNANYSLHSGHPLLGRPSMGAWASYGLGTENANLPSFVVLHGGQVPSGGMVCFNSGFLPANHQGSILQPTNPILRNVRATRGEDRACRRASSTALAQADRRLARQARARPGGRVRDPELRARLPDADGGAGGDRDQRRERGDQAAVRAGCQVWQHAETSAPSACSPAAWWSAGCASSS